MSHPSLVSFTAAMCSFFCGTMMCAAPVRADEPRAEGLQAAEQPANNHVGSVEGVGSVEPTPEPLVERQWYGWQILATDGASVAAVLVTKSPYVLAAGYTLGGPTIHLLHERPGATLGSLGLRLLLPIGGAFIGAASSSCGGSHDDFCNLGGLVYGFVGGMIVASLTDALALSWEDVPVAPKAPAISIAPSAVVVPGGSVWGVSGAF